MSNDDMAAAVLECVGGHTNVLNNSLCATRLRISVRDVSLVNRNALNSIKGVLGVADHGTHGIEVIFGPNLVRGVFRSLERLTGILGGEHESAGAPVRHASNFKVTITPETPGMRKAQQKPSVKDEADQSDLDNSDTSALLEILDN